MYNLVLNFNYGRRENPQPNENTKHNVHYMIYNNHVSAQK